MSAARILQQIRNLEKSINNRYQNYINTTMNNPGRYARFNRRNDNAKLKQLRKNLNLAINKEGNSLAKDLRNAEANYKKLKNASHTNLYNLRRTKYRHLFSDPRYPYMRSYERAGNHGLPTSNQFLAEAKAIMNAVNSAEKRMYYLKKKFNQRQNMAREIIRKHVKNPTPGGLLNKIRYEPNYGLVYANTRSGSLLAKPRTNANWVRLLREARRQGRRQGISLRTVKNVRN